MCRYALIFTMFFCLFHSSVGAVGEVEIIEDLTKQIEQATSDEEKSRLYIYRARHFSELKNDIQAELDYDAALEYDHKGWIHLERGKFFLSRGNAVQAAREAVVAQLETPTLKSESLKIVDEARKIYKKTQQDEGPFREILLTKVWRVKGKSVEGQNSKGSVRGKYFALNKLRKNNRRSRS